MTAEKAIYIRLKDNLLKFKSPMFREWAKNSFPNFELHHCFGSHTGSKTSDYFILPLTRAEHEEAEKRKSEYAIEHLHESLNILQSYIKYLEGKVHK